MDPNTALFFYDAKGVQRNALLVEYRPPTGTKAELVDLVFVDGKGKLQTMKDVQRRGAGIEKNCFKVRG